MEVFEFWGQQLESSGKGSSPWTLRRLWIPLSGELEEEERVMKEDVRVVWEISEELQVYLDGNILWFEGGAEDKVGGSLSSCS